MREFLEDESAVHEVVHAAIEEVGPDHVVLRVLAHEVSGEGLLLAVAEDFHLQCVADVTVAAHEVAHAQHAKLVIAVVAAGVDLVAVHLEDDVAVLQADQFGGAAFGDLADIDALLFLAHAKVLPELVIERLLEFDAEAGEALDNRHPRCP